MTCAVRLAEAGHRVDVLARDLPLETTSVVAAALWYPYLAAAARTGSSPGAPSPTASFADLRRRGRHRRADAARHRGAARAGTRTPGGRPRCPTWRASVRRRRVRRRVVVHRARSSTCRSTCDWLRARLDELGGTLTRISLGALPQPATTTSSSTAPGSALAPARRRRRRPPGPRPGGRWSRASSSTAGGWTRPVRRTSCRAARQVVVGGTDEEGDWSRTPSPETATDDPPAGHPAGARARRRAASSATGSGLRPVRPAVRLEAEGRSRPLLRPRRRRRHPRAGAAPTRWRRLVRRARLTPGRERTHSPARTARGRMRRMARDFKTIGVVGLGTMGAGIAEVFARHGYDVVGVEVDDDGVERGRQHLEHSTGRAVSRGKLTEEEQKALLGRVTLRHLARGAQGRRPRGRGGRGVASTIKKQIFKQLDGIVSRRRRSSPRTPPRSRSPRSPPPTSSPAGSSACTSSTRRPVQGFVEIVRTVVTEPEVLEDVSALVQTLGKNPVVCGDKAGLHRQHPAVRLPQPRGVDVREPLRLPRGHRRRDALRLRLPDGSAGPARPDRPRHGVRDPRHDVPPGPRPPARARRRSSSRWSPPACSVARPAGASTPTRAPDSPVVVPDDAHALGRRQARSCKHDDQRRSASSAPARWRPASSRSSPRAGTTSSTSAARQDKVDGVRGDHRALAGQGDPARQARGVGQGRRARPADRVAPRSTTSPTSTSWSRRSPRT